MFEQLLEKPRSTKKWLFVPLSLLVHGLVVAAVIISPLLSTAVELPMVKEFTVSLAAPSPPPVPVNNGGGGRKPVRKEMEANEMKPQEVQSDQIFVPPDIPLKIEDESLKNFGNGPDIGTYIPGALSERDYYNDRVNTRHFLLGKQGLKNQEALPISVQMPSLIKKIEPLYPRAAILAHIKGIVIIEAVTDIYGRVVKTNVISGHPLLKQAAVQAVMQWIYEPYMVNGIPKPVRFTVNVNFTLQR